MGGRQTATLLVLAILASEMLLTGKAQAMWHAMWGGPHGLGQESGGGGSSIQGVAGASAGLWPTSTGNAQ